MGSAVWNPVLVDLLCDLVIKEVEANNQPNSHLSKEVKIVIATMTLHNYIRRHANRDAHFVRWTEMVVDIPNDEVEMDNDGGENEHGHDAREIEAIRNEITQSLMSARII